jgi:hypothetical protein
MSTNSTDSTNNLEDNNNLSTTTNNETSENTSSASLSSTIQDSTKQISDSIKQETSQDSENSNIQNFTDTVFTTTNMLVLAGFLGAYGIVYYFSKRNNNEMEGMPSSNGTNPTSIAIDMFFLIIVGFILYTLYTTLSKSDGDSVTGEVIDNISEFVDNPMSVLIAIFVIIGFYILTYMFGIPMDKDGKPYSISAIESTLWVSLVVILILDFFKYIFGWSLDDIMAQIKSLFGGETSNEEDEEKKEGEEAEEESDQNEETTVGQQKCKEYEEEDDPNAEVFNVSNNLYTYDDANAICKSYDAKLATYDQVEKAYNNGAEWCNYGWSEGQLALFPTQKSTYDELQKLDVGVTDPTKKRGNNCGRPGINGGYIANPYVRFGVNCYGKKPDATDADLQMMENKKNQVYPKTPEELELEKKIEHWKKNKNKYLTLNSYNTQKWSSKNGSSLSSTEETKQ